MNPGNEGRTIKNINIFFCVVIVLAIFLRLAGLGSSSLTMNEAENAMAALNLFKHGETSQLLYTLITYVFFTIFSSS